MSQRIVYRCLPNYRANCVCSAFDSDQDCGVELDPPADEQTRRPKPGDDEPRETHGARRRPRQ